MTLEKVERNVSAMRTLRTLSAAVPSGVIRSSGYGRIFGGSPAGLIEKSLLEQSRINQAKILPIFHVISACLFEKCEGLSSS